MPRQDRKLKEYNLIRVSDLDVTASATRVELRKAIKRKGTELLKLRNERI